MKLYVLMKNKKKINETMIIQKKCKCQEILEKLIVEKKFHYYVKN